MQRFLPLGLLLIPALLFGKEKETGQGTVPAAARPVEAPAVPKSVVVSPGVAVSPAEPVLVIGTVAQWRAKAEERYPALGEPGSAFHVAFELAYKEKLKESPDFFRANDWPLRLAESIDHSLKATASSPRQPTEFRKSRF